MPDIDFISTEDVAWATGEDVAFAGTPVMTTLRYNFLFDSRPRGLLFDSGNKALLFDNHSRELTP